MKKISLFMMLTWGALAARTQTLWKITPKGGDKSSYILLAGPACTSSMNLTPGMKTALAQVSAVAMDYNLYDNKDAAKWQAYSFPTVDSQRINNNLSAGEIQTFNTILKNNGLPDQMVQQFDGFRVEMVYYLLLMLNSPCGTLTQLPSYETVLRPYAQKNNLDYLVLQPTDDYLAEDSRRSNGYWQQNIRYMLNNEDEIKGKLQTEEKLYEQSNLAGLKDLYTRDKLYQLRTGDAITRQHIPYLAGKIADQIKQRPTFIAIQYNNVVGASPSLFDELEAKGYTITAVQ
jgi:TraB/PrgY/gumN family